MNAGVHVQITKLKALPEAQVSTATWAEYHPGEDNEKSPPVDYTLKGVLAADVVVGAPMFASRYERNGERVTGTFSTSVVTKVIGNCVYTRNSLYIVKILSEPTSEIEL